MNKLSSLVAGLVLIAGAAPAFADEQQLEALHVARVAGMCGTIRQISLYQSSIQAPGVDQFLLQFVESESARFGIAVEAFLSNCRRVTAEFHQLVERLEQGDSG